MSFHAERSLRGALAVEVDAQAKLNLRLQILARETTGFHQLETLFLRVELADTLRLRCTTGAFTVDVTGDVDLALVGPPEQNLALRAARAYAVASGMRGGVAIEIEKRIPIGGGMGGGSADAGAVLRALDAMADAPIGPAALHDVAAALGSDVPFLASEMTYALAWGRGERMLSLTPPPVRNVALLVPSISVNTAEAYSWLAASRASASPRPTAVALEVDHLSDWEHIARIGVNEFEDVVSARYPTIGALIDSLHGAGFAIAMMSGSGSTVFGISADDLGHLSHVGETTRVIRTRTATNVAPVRMIAS
ncbi:MAG: 4-(cytidine 5'-diphospho)-2-C-methyl-D-erythritol kinase [Gemmatimonadota bacterium]